GIGGMAAPPPVMAVMMAGDVSAVRVGTLHVRAARVFIPGHVRAASDGTGRRRAAVERSAAEAAVAAADVAATAAAVAAAAASEGVGRDKGRHAKRGNGRNGDNQFPGHGFSPGFEWRSFGFASGHWSRTQAERFTNARADARRVSPSL